MCILHVCSATFLELENEIFNQGYNAVINTIYSGFNKYGILEYTIEFASGEWDKVLREYLSHPGYLYVASLPTTLPDG